MLVLLPLAVWLRLPLNCFRKGCLFANDLMFGGRPSFVANRFKAKDAVLGVPFEFFYQVFD